MESVTSSSVVRDTSRVDGGSCKPCWNCRQDRVRQLGVDLQLTAGHDELSFNGAGRSFDIRRPEG